MAETERFWIEIKKLIEGEKDIDMTIIDNIITMGLVDRNFRVIVPKHVSLYEFAEKFNPDCHNSVMTLNDLYYGCGYDYCDDYPNKRVLAEEDSKCKGWIEVFEKRIK